MTFKTMVAVKLYCDKILVILLSQGGNMLRKRIGKILIAAWLMAFIFSINPIEVLAA